LSEKLSDGKSVLDFCNSFSPGTRRVVIIRHSERISFHNVPMDRWDGVGITEKGFVVARDLGRLFADDGDVSRLNVYGWGRRRCHETADAIAEGVREIGRPVRRLGSLSLGGPISDYAAYKEWILSGRYQEMLEVWQRAGDTKGSLTPIAEYSTHVFREILDPRISPPKEVSVIVTHDFHIFPLACHAFGTLVGLPDYLDGIVIGETESGLRIGYRGSVCSTDLASLTR
jgi:broad specificity phosphatase PhoE